MRILIKEGQLRRIIEALSYNGSTSDFILMSRNELKKLISAFEESEGFDEYQFKSAVNGLVWLQKVLKGNSYLELYRVVSANDINNIDLKNIGNHFTYDKNIYQDMVSVHDIGFKSGEKFYMITIRTSIENVDIRETIEANINYPFEKEIFINKFDDIEIVSVVPFEVSFPNWN